MKRLLVPVLLLLAACERAPPAPVPREDVLATAVAPGNVPLPDASAETALAPAAGTGAPADLVVLRFDCRGSDPDWRLRLGADGRGRLREDGGDTELAGELRLTGGGHAWRGTPVDGGGGSWAALVTATACFPPEGGNAKEFTVALGWADGRQGYGCCSSVRGLDVHHAADFVPEAKATGWSARLPATLDPVERCARDAGVDARAVVDLRDGIDGRLVVRLRDSDDARFDCLLDPGGGDIEAVVPVRPDDRAAREGEREWLPADPDRPPVLSCGRVFATRDADGRLRGWLHQREGC